MQMKTLIVDDEPIALAKLQSYVEKVPFLSLAGACTSASEALTTIAETEIDLLITDISMPDISGMEMIKCMQNPPLIIFTTAFNEYAVDSYRVSAVDYLLKPYSFSEFHKAAEKAFDRLKKLSVPSMPHLTSQQTSANHPLFIKSDYRYIRIDPFNIIYIKGYGEYLQIYLADETKPFLTLSSFRDISQILPDCFMQVHRSYIVNINHVNQIYKSRIIMNNNTEIPVGDSYRQAVQNYLNSHSISPGKKV